MAEIVTEDVGWQRCESSRCRSKQSGYEPRSKELPSADTDSALRLWWQILDCNPQRTTASSIVIKAVFGLTLAGVGGKKVRTVLERKF